MATQSFSRRSAVYSTEGRLARKFLTSTKQALKSIADVTNLLKQHFELPDYRSVAGVSRTSAYLHLLHHQVRSEDRPTMNKLMLYI